MVLKPSFSDNINCGEIYRTNRKQSIQNYIKVCLNENICLKTEYFYCPETMVREAFIQYLQKMGMLFYLRAFVILFSCQGNKKQTSSFIKLTFLIAPPPPTFKKNYKVFFFLNKINIYMYLFIEWVGVLLIKIKYTN